MQQSSPCFGNQICWLRTDLGWCNSVFCLQLQNLTDFFNARCQWVLHKKGYYLGRNNWSLTALSCLKSARTPGSAFLGNSCRVSPSLNPDILPQVHSARPGCCWRGRHESQAAAAGTLSLRGEVFQAAAATQSKALPSLKSPLQACIFILLLIWDMTLVACAAQEGQLVVCECQGKQSFGYLHAECSETHLIAAIYSSDPPDSQKFPFHPKE